MWSTVDPIKTPLDEKSIFRKKEKRTLKCLLFSLKILRAISIKNSIPYPYPYPDILGVTDRLANIIGVG